MTENEPSGQPRLSTTYVWMAVTFCVCLVASNIFAPRLWQLGHLPVQLTGGVVIFPVSYILNDCLSEVYGYRKTQQTIWMGFAMCFLVTVMSFLVTILPDPLYESNLESARNFDTLFALVPRAMAGSLLAFISGSTVNAFVMSRMKVAQKGKGFGWRAILSSVAGEAVDSAVFFPIAFGGTMPLRGLLGMIAIQVCVKVIYEIVILPVTTVGVRHLKKYEGIDTYDNNISYNPFSVFKKQQKA